MATIESKNLIDYLHRPTLDEMKKFEKKVDQIPHGTHLLDSFIYYTLRNELYLGVDLSDVKKPETLVGNIFGQPACLKLSVNHIVGPDTPPEDSTLMLEVITGRAEDLPSLGGFRLSSQTMLEVHSRLVSPIEEKFNFRGRVLTIGFKHDNHIVDSSFAWLMRFANDLTSRATQTPTSA